MTPIYGFFFRNHAAVATVPRPPCQLIQSL